MKKLFFIYVSSVLLIGCHGNAPKGVQNSEYLDITDSTVTIDVLIEPEADFDTQDIIEIEEISSCSNAVEIIGYESVYDVAVSCGLSCLAEYDPEDCTTICIVEETGIAGECANCYAVWFICTIDHCLAECAIDPDSLECIECQESNGCNSDFYICSGFSP